MVLLNFSHPISETQFDRITAMLGELPEIREVPSPIDRARPNVDAVVELLDGIGLTPAEWQTLPLIINPPALAPVALTLIAELHGRCGYFPAMLNIRPVAESTPMRYEIAEIVNLQAVRDLARARR
jgi:hypothetical protein